MLGLKYFAWTKLYLNFCLSQITFDQAPTGIQHLLFYSLKSILSNQHPCISGLHGGWIPYEMAWQNFKSNFTYRTIRYKMYINVLHFIERRMTFGDSDGYFLPYVSTWGTNSQVTKWLFKMIRYDTWIKWSMYPLNFRTAREVKYQDMTGVMMICIQLLFYWSNSQSSPLRNWGQIIIVSEWQVQHILERT